MQVRPDAGSDVGALAGLCGRRVDETAITFGTAGFTPEAGPAAPHP